MQSQQRNSRPTTHLSFQRTGLALDSTAVPSGCLVDIYQAEYLFIVYVAPRMNGTAWSSKRTHIHQAQDLYEVLGGVGQPANDITGSMVFGKIYICVVAGDRTKVAFHTCRTCTAGSLCPDPAIPEQASVTLLRTFRAHTHMSASTIQ